MADNQSSISFLGRRLPPSFERRVILILPDLPLVYDSAQWLDAIVVVEDGEIELEHLDGGRYTFRRGDVLWLYELPLQALHSRGLECAVLVAISRRANESRG